MKLHTKKILGTLFIAVSQILSAQLTPSQNYAYTKTCLNDDCSKKTEAVEYTDGLDRKIQTILIKGSPTQKDIVSHTEYDGLGRQVNSYLPVPQAGSQDGGFYNAPLANATAVYGNEKIYSQAVFEESPIGKVKQTYSTGNSWSTHPRTYGYDVNADGEVKKYTTTATWQEGRTESALVFSGNYSEEQLLRSTVTDEDGNTTISFVNSRGKTILVRKMLTATDKADTYYVYNQYDQLAYVISPLASVKTVLSENDKNELCYQYRYDAKGRQVEKKLPGKGWEYMVYDQLGRLVFSQDAKLATIDNSFSAQGWMFTKYDQYGRTAYSGFYISSLSREQLQNELNQPSRKLNNETRSTSFSNSVYYTNTAYPIISGNSQILSVNYYDSYPTGTPALPATIFSVAVVPNTIAGAVYLKNLPVASFIKTLGNNTWTKSYIWYDYKQRAVGSHTVNHLGGYTKTESQLDFTGVVQKTNTYHKRSSLGTEIQIAQEFVYDHQNRLLKQYHEVVGKSPKELLTQNKYKETGELEEKKVGGDATGNNPLQTVAYSYNIHGQLKGINLDTAGNFQSGKLFNYKINYNDALMGLAQPNNEVAEPVTQRFNGSIAEVAWRNSSDTGIKKYGYVYDKLGRLVAGLYQNPNNPASKEHSEIVGYDLNGNITSLKRSAYFVGTAASLIDDLVYSYSGGNGNSNRLSQISDNALDFNGYEGGDSSAIPYDANGNSTAIPGKGISDISYNYLSLPTSVSQYNTTTTYQYRADGVKVKKQFMASNKMGTSIINTEYLDGFQYSTPNTDPLRTALEVQDESTMSMAKAGEPEAFSAVEMRAAAVGPGTPTVDNMVLSFFPTSEGYYDYENLRYIYQYKDHLGNVRVSYVKNSAGVLEVKDTNDYYPFGMNHLRETEAVYDPMSVPYNYKYSGKELQETGMYDFGARLYMPDLGRWGVVDPLAETTRRLNPYNYAMDNPVMFIDPDGMKAYYAEGISSGIPEGSILFRTSWGSYGSESGSAGGSGSVEKGGGGGDATIKSKDSGKGLWGSIKSFFNNLFGGSKSNNGAIKQTRSGVGILMPGAYIFEGYAAGTAATETAVTGTGLLGGLTLGALLMPTMIAEPEFDWTRQFDKTRDIPITTTGEPSGVEFFYRAMSYAEYKQAGGYLTQRLNESGIYAGEGPYVTRRLEYAQKATFSFGYADQYDLIVQYAVPQGTYEMFKNISLPARGTTMRQSEQLGLPIKKREGGDFNFSFYGTNTTIFNSVVIGLPQIISVK